VVGLLEIFVEELQPLRLHPVKQIQILKSQTMILTAG
jgi:hypothetical protein